nr:MAG TPA: hypothetical protein [Ackermannviridae sp.]
MYGFYLPYIANLIKLTFKSQPPAEMLVVSFYYPKKLIANRIK